MEKDIDRLFSFVSPNDLRKSVLHVFFGCCSNRQEAPDNFEKITEDIQHLIHFLDRATEHQLQ